MVACLSRWLVRRGKTRAPRDPTDYITGEELAINHVSVRQITHLRFVVPAAPALPNPSSHLEIEDAPPRLSTANALNNSLELLTLALSVLDELGGALLGFGEQRQEGNNHGCKLEKRQRSDWPTPKRRENITD